ncbi:MAG: HAD family hydrolase [Chloroflexia bacterium]|nr:HAD family hydrolase [Chloroflexia bacterium]
MIELIAFDADDTLWQNERLYTATQKKLARLLAPYADEQGVHKALYATEMDNLELYGYGIKAFTLSMMETAIDLSQNRIGSREIRQIIDWARDMLWAEVQLLPHAAETLAQLSASYPLMLMTKGDLLDQRRKLERSGLGGYFDHVEIVSHKGASIYRDLLERHGLEPPQFVMVGDSLRSDVLPVVEIGGHAVHIPPESSWAHERVPAHQVPDGYHQLEHLGQLPGLIEQLG